MARNAEVERKVIKCIVEARPLRSASIPPCSISCVAVARDEESGLLVYLGTDAGHCLLYGWRSAPEASDFGRIHPLQSSPSRNSVEVVSPRTPDSSSRSAESRDLKLLAQKQMGKGAVSCICLLPNAGQVAVLVDAQVLLLSSQSLALVVRVLQSRGASVIAPGFGFEVRPQNNAGATETVAGSPKQLDAASRLAVAVKAKILLFEVARRQGEKENQASFVPGGTGVNPHVMKEISGVEGVLSMAWIGDSLVIGTRHEYVLFSIRHGQATQLFSFPPEHPWLPLIKPFPKDLEALLVIDIAGILINAQGQPVAGSLVFSGVPDAVGQCSPYAVVVKQGTVELYHCKTGRKVQSLAFGPVSGGRCHVADANDNTVVIASVDKVSCFVQMSLEEQLKELLKQKEYLEAVALAEEHLVPGDEETVKEKAYVHAEAGFLLLADLRFAEAIDQFLQSEIVEPSELFPFFPSLSSRWRNMIPRKRYWSLHSPPQALHVVIENGLASMQNGLLASPYGDLKRTRAVLGGDAPNRTVLINQHLTTAIQHFIRYWETTRNRPLTATVREGVDTILVKLYAESGASKQLEQLAASNNSCLLEEVEGLLRNSGHLRALALLYESKKMLGAALQIWQHLAQAGNESYPVYEAARLLETSCDSTLVLHHVHWVIKTDEKLALQILTSPARKEVLPAEEVLRLLASESKLVHQRYLQWLIEEQGSEDLHIHTELAMSLVDSALNTSTCTAETRQTLQTFLEKSDKYDAGQVLGLLEGTHLWKEQAILHMKRGSELLALNILALKLEDADAAERYCAELGRPDAYMQLLDIYLKPGENLDPLYEAAVQLLCRHGATLDPLQVLEVLPPDMPLQKASQALTRMLRARVHSHRQGQIAKNLTKAVNFQARLDRLKERSREIQITSDNVCASCRARIGTKLFAVYPDNSTVCYKCLRLRGENQ